MFMAIIHRIVELEETPRMALQSNPILPCRKSKSKHPSSLCLKTSKEGDSTTLRGKSWFKAFLQKPKKGSDLSGRSLNNAPESSSSISLPPLVRSSSSSAVSPKQVSSTSQVNTSSSESIRRSKLYDVCICHNEGDLEFVEKLVSYLESQPEHFRCFLQPRDAALGSAIVTELFDAVQNSHCWVLLITPKFLTDPWCRYQMHHALTEAPMANGRTIPVLKDMDRKDYPRELRCIYYISVAIWETSFKQIKETLIRYLQELCENTSKTD